MYHSPLRLTCLSLLPRPNSFATHTDSVTLSHAFYKTLCVCVCVGVCVCAVYKIDHNIFVMCYRSFMELAA